MLEVVSRETKTIVYSFFMNTIAALKEEELQVTLV
jgi:hypothetical protein